MKCYTTGELMRMSHDDLREHAQKLQSEHTALLAVAEVLKRVETIPHFAHESVEATRGTKVFAGRNKLADDMRQALATLAQIQKGE